MSYYFTIIGTRDNPLFELDFGTSKVGGDGIARFREEAKHMNQFIVHAALDLVEEAQWTTKDLYACLISQDPHCAELAFRYDYVLTTTQLPQESRQLPKQPHPHLPHRRQRQIHATHEPGPERHHLLQLSDLTTITT